MKWVLWILGALLAVVLLVGAYLYSQVDELEAVQVTDDLYMLKGIGGNVGVLATGSGTVIVDTMTFESQGDAIRAKAEELTGEPVVMVINTHYHFDHTHGNPAFGDETRYISTAKTKHYLETRDADFWTGVGMPTETFDGHEHVVTLGDKTIRLLHPGRGHTDGDLVAHFVEERAMHMGDLYFNKSYPFIDLEAGGSVAAWPQTLDNVLTLPIEYVLPGHGELSNMGELGDFRAFMQELGNLGHVARERGWTAEEALEAQPLTTDEGYGSPMGINIGVATMRNDAVTAAISEAQLRDEG